MVFITQRCGLPFWIFQNSMQQPSPELNRTILEISSELHRSAVSIGSSRGWCVVWLSEKGTGLQSQMETSETVRLWHLHKKMINEEKDERKTPDTDRPSNDFLFFQKLISAHEKQNLKRCADR